MIGTSRKLSSARISSISSSPLTWGSWMSVITRSGSKARAASSATRLSVTAFGLMPMRGEQVAEQLDVQRIVLDNQDLGQIRSPHRRVTDRLGDDEQSDK